MKHFLFAALCTVAQFCSAQNEEGLLPFTVSVTTHGDEAAGEFTHSERYLADIQLKMALLSAQAEAE